MTEEMKKKLQTTQRRMMRMITQTKRASVDDTIDVEPHDSDNALVDDTIEHNDQDLNEHQESSNASTKFQTTIEKTS